MRAPRALILLIVGFATSMADAAPRRAAKATPASPDVFGGYSYTHAGDASLNGIGFSGSYPIGPKLSLVLDLSGHDGSFAGADIDQLGLMAGVRWRAGSGRLRPFAEGLLGGVRTSFNVETGDTRVSDSDTDWGVALGGGADYRLKGRWSLRGLFHLRLLEGEGAWDFDPRITVGAVYQLGR